MAPLDGGILSKPTIWKWVVEELIYLFWIVAHKKTVLDVVVVTSAAAILFQLMLPTVLFL